jgi:hypothetical protein
MAPKLEVADPEMVKTDLFREAMKVFVRVQAGKRLAARGGKSPPDEVRSAAAAGEGFSPLTRALTDSSVWVAHFRKANPTLQSLLTADQILPSADRDGNRLRHTSGATGANLGRSQAT